MCSLKCCPLLKLTVSSLFLSHHPVGYWMMNTPLCVQMSLSDNHYPPFLWTCIYFQLWLLLYKIHFPTDPKGKTSVAPFYLFGSNMDTFPWYSIVRTGTLRFSKSYGSFSNLFLLKHDSLKKRISLSNAFGKCCKQYFPLGNFKVYIMHKWL